MEHVKVKSAEIDLVPVHFEGRNAEIMRFRAIQWHETMIEALEANLAWRGRMWRTPDVAPCLGRYMRPEPKR